MGTSGGPCLQPRQRRACRTEQWRNLVDKHWTARLSHHLYPVLAVGVACLFTQMWTRGRPGLRTAWKGALCAFLVCYGLIFTYVQIDGHQYGVLVTAAGAAGEYPRLRFPAEWTMYLANLIVASVLFDALVLGKLKQRQQAGPHAAPAPEIQSEKIGVAGAGDPVAAARLLRGSPSANRSRAQATAPHGPPQPLPGPNRTDREVVIMGAGPAGLTAAYELTRYGVPAQVLDMDSRYVGGISRTEDHSGYRFDIGGHRFFSKSQEIEDFWTEVAGDLLFTRGRLSRIYYQGKYFAYPLKAGNALLNMGPVETVRCLSSYAWAKFHPIKNPQTLEDWVRNQFGYRLFSIFFKTYTEKVWGISTKELSADWAAQRIKGMDLVQAIKSALPGVKRKSKDRGAVIKTLIDEFRYPRLGPGQLWERVRDLLIASGQQVQVGQQVVAVHHREGRVTSLLVRDIGTGQERTVSGSDFISTLPIRELVEHCHPPLPVPVRAAAAQLKYRDFLTVAVIIDRAEMFPDNWIYIHDPSVQVGRMQNFKNWSPEMVPDPSKTCLGLEYFCFEGDGLWDSSDQQLVELARRELVQLGMCHAQEVLGGVVVRQPKAYPVYDDVYKQHLAVIRDYLRQALPNLHLVGRNGMHHYNNQDHSMMTALLVARNIATGTHFDPWKVNTDAEYHEEARVEDEDRSGRLVPSRVPSLAHVEK
jgi:protoporphyrinogen oxidase